MLASKIKSNENDEYNNIISDNTAKLCKHIEFEHCNFEVDLLFNICF